MVSYFTKKGNYASYKKPVNNQPKRIVAVFDSAALCFQTSDVVAYYDDFSRVLKEAGSLKQLLAFKEKVQNIFRQYELRYHVAASTSELNFLELQVSEENRTTLDNLLGRYESIYLSGVFTMAFIEDTLLKLSEVMKLPPERTTIELLLAKTNLCLGSRVNEPLSTINVTKHSDIFGEEYEDLTLQNFRRCIMDGLKMLGGNLQWTVNQYIKASCAFDYEAYRYNWHQFKMLYLAYQNAIKRIDGTKEDCRLAYADYAEAYKKLGLGDISSEQRMKEILNAATLDTEKRNGWRKVIKEERRAIKTEGLGVTYRMPLRIDQIDQASSKGSHRPRRRESRSKTENSA